MGYDARFEPPRNLPPQMISIRGISRNCVLEMSDTYDPQELLVDRVILGFHFLKPLDNTAIAQT